jgi:hypothetical protein
MDMNRVDYHRKRMLAPERKLSPGEILADEKPRLRYLGPGIWLKVIREAANGGRKTP